MTNARDIAYDMTRRVNARGSYLNLLLRYGMDSSDLAPRDRALVVEMVYGVQRHRNRLDFMIGTFSRRPLDDIHPEVLDILRLGMYQLSQMRVPQHAAVNETVNLAKRRVGHAAASFVNAIMRSASRGPERVSWPGREDLPSYLEVIHSYPRWLVDYLLRLLGPRETERLCAAQNEIPSLTLRANTTRIDAAALLLEIESSGGRGSLSAHVAEALTDVSLPYHDLLGLIDRGCCVVQDESSILVGRAVDPSPGDVAIDACAAPGGKATHLAVLGGKDCSVIAVDINASRLEALRNSIHRMGLANIEIKKGDSTRLMEYVTTAADIVLVDAPCSGLGTLQRNPELKWRRLPDDLAELAGLQLSLLERCSANVRKGGTLVYSVCTYSREETVDVISAFLESSSDFQLQSLTPYLPSSCSDALSPEGYAQLWPHVHHMEGMFIARMVRA
ncbi:MAG: 16S rRNA (cytosine(967)-C(5))-methyltransferase RsmB [Actinobacteria bacterium]|nr:16S rRNA (cytosine(967)-C(5))-methyltransferase RsmB [Actinomycetota bacterium]